MPSDNTMIHHCMEGGWATGWITSQLPLSSEMGCLQSWVSLRAENLRQDSGQSQCMARQRAGDPVY